jgi:branched-chain amino acid transport system ATP-binding protein
MVDEKIKGYGAGTVETVISFEKIAEESKKLFSNKPDAKLLEEIIEKDSYLSIDLLKSGYGKMEILHDINLRIGEGQSLCLIGPNGAGKSTILHSIFGLNDIFDGTITLKGENITRLTPHEKLKKAGIAYILQASSIFPDMTVEENLWMGGYLDSTFDNAKGKAVKVLDKYERLAQRRYDKAKVLSGGERRLLEISRALIMEPSVLLVDEPSIGLEPKYIDMVFNILSDLQKVDGKTIIMVEQNAKKGLEFADIGYVLASGEVVLAGKGDDLLKNEAVGRLFLGG